MAFGVRSADAEPQEFSTDFIRSFKVGETTVRFCQEADDWIEFYEHYTADQKSYPCTRDRKNCPGCNSENEKERKASRKFGTTIKIIDEKRDDDLYLPIRVPTGVEKKMRTRSERNGDTLLNRDYIILKEGTGFDTTYDVETDEKYVIAKKELADNCFDIEEILQKMWNEIWVDKPADDDDKPKSKSKDDDADEVITEAQLKKMGIRDLRKLAIKAEMEEEQIEEMSKSEIIEALIEVAGEDDKPPF